RHSVLARSDPAVLPGERRRALDQASHFRAVRLHRPLRGATALVSRPHWHARARRSNRFYSIVWRRPRVSGGEGYADWIQRGQTTADLGSRTPLIWWCAVWHVGDLWLLTTTCARI